MRIPGDMTQGDEEKELRKGEAGRRHDEGSSWLHDLATSVRAL
jgi:hypothetical protein